MICYCNCFSNISADDNDMLEEQLNNFIQTKFNGLSINDEGLNDKILKKSIVKLNN